MLFIAIPATWLAGLILAAICNVFSFIFLGKYLSFVDGSDEMLIVRDFKTKECKIFPVVGGKRCTPIWFILAGLVLWALYTEGKSVASATADIVLHPQFWIVILYVAACIGTVASVALTSLLTAKFFRSEVWLLFRAWCKAKKEKVCPIIKVVE